MFDRCHGLAGHADAVGKFLLGHLVVLEAQATDLIGDRGAGHQSSILKWTIWMISRTSAEKARAKRVRFIKMIAVAPAGSAS